MSCTKSDLCDLIELQENASRPEGIPPSRGGKFVGFGSSPSPKSHARGSGSDMSAMLYKGWGNLTQIAGSAAQQATTAVKSGTENLSHVLKDGDMAERVQQNARVLADRGRELGRTGWSGLRSIYATVASRVENAARDTGYSIDLGSGKVAADNQKSNGSLNTASYSRLSHSESDGLDNLLNKQKRVVHEHEAFHGFGESDPESPSMHQRDATGKGTSGSNGYTLAASKHSSGSTSGPIVHSKQKTKEWEDWNDSDEEDEVDEDWGKW